jgi:hypothetical protein
MHGLRVPQASSLTYNPTLVEVREEQPGAGVQLRRLGEYLLAGHCTGIDATWRPRAALGLARETAPMSSVGSSFTLGKGMLRGVIPA